MPRGKRSGPAGFVVTPTEQTAHEPSGTEPNAQTEDQLAAGADEGQKQPRARITRWNEGMRTYATLDNVSAINVDEDWIRTEYGGGKYLVYYWGTMEDGTYGYLKKKGKEFIIDDSIPFKGAMRERPAAGHNGPVAPGSSLMDMGMLQIFKNMQDNSAMMMQQARDHSSAMMAMMERMAAPRDSGIKDLIIVLTPILAPLISGMVGRKDPVELATQIANLARDGGHGNSVKETLGALREMIEMRELLGPGGGEDSEGRWIGMLEKVIPGALDLLKQESQRTGQPITAIARRTAQPSSVPAQLSPAAPPSSLAAVPPSSAPPTTETRPVDEWTPLEPYAVRLAELAAQNKEPFSVMHMVLAMAPPQMLAAVRELVAREDAVQILVTRFPVLAPYQAWTAQLVDEFHAEFFGGDEEPHDDDATLPGDSPAAPTL